MLKHGVITLIFLLKLSENSMGVQITRLMRENPRITIKEIAQRLDVSVRGVKYNINLLKENGRIERRGSTKSGTWVVLK